MKRLAAAIIMFTAVVGVALFESVYVVKVSEKAESALKTALVQYQEGNFGKAEENIEIAINVWEQSSEVLNSMLIHNSTESVAEKITTVKNVLRYERSEFVTECEKTISDIEFIKNSMIPYIYNIL